jgi:hypothetical protein
MPAQPTPTDPLELGYRPRDAATRYVSLGELLAATAVFAVSHLAAEYACQTYYHLSGVQPGSYAFVRAVERREMHMAIETVWVGLCSTAFFIAQGLLRPNAAARVRPRAWLVAAVAGIASCLVRWLIWYASRGVLPDFARFGVAVALAIALAIVVSRYRWPRRGIEPPA